MSSRKGFVASASSAHQAAAFRIHLLAGKSNPELAEKISAILNIPLTDCNAHNKSSGEISAKTPLSIAGGDVFIIQPGCANAVTGLDVNDALFELLFLIRRAKLCRAARITAIVPFFPYARQDRKTAFRCPLSASAVCTMLETAGVDRVLTMDIHSGQTQGCFNGVAASLDDLPFYRDFADHLKSLPWFNPEDTVVVSPDAGGVPRAKLLADTLDIKSVVTIIKRRAQAGVVDTMQTVGDVAGLNCIIIDDMVDSGGTLCKAVQYLKQLGGKKIVACVTHGILTEPCIDNVNKTPELESLVISDTIPHAHDAPRCPRLVILPTAPALAKAIFAIHSELSLGSAFKYAFEFTHDFIANGAGDVAAAGAAASSSGRFSLSQHAVSLESSDVVVGVSEAELQPVGGNEKQ